MRIRPVRRPSRRWWPLLAVALMGAAPEADAPEPLPGVLGRESNVLVEPGDTLLDIAYRARLGFEAVQRLNPDVDPWIPLAGTVVRLPTRYLPPRADLEGLVINVPEMRLYAFDGEGGHEVFAIAIGDKVDPTLLGDFRVGEKRTDPAWRVPLSIQEEEPELPAVVPPGPDNPLGSRWMTVGRTSYGIHGTNTRWSIGRMATHGCIRLYEPEMERLFDATPTGTRIQIVYQPFKWGRAGERLMLEVHPDRYGVFEDPVAAALERPAELGLLPHVDRERVRVVLEEARGVPREVGALPPAPVEPAPTSTPTS